MMRRVAILLGLALAGCATTDVVRPTDVTRYHLGARIAPGSVAIEPLASGETISPEYAAYADAVAAELARLGFQPVRSGGASDYVAGVSFVRALRGQVRTPPKFSIGIGGGSYGGSVGLGGGIGTGIGSKTRDVVATQLAVQLRRRGDSTTVWEGRAQREGLARPGEWPSADAGRLAAALFGGFPGESGITISVP